MSLTLLQLELHLVKATDSLRGKSVIDDPLTGRFIAMPLLAKDGTKS